MTKKWKQQPGLPSDFNLALSKHNQYIDPISRSFIPTTPISCDGFLRPKIERHGENWRSGNQRKGKEWRLGCDGWTKGKRPKKFKGINFPLLSIKGSVEGPWFKTALFWHGFRVSAIGHPDRAWLIQGCWKKTLLHPTTWWKGTLHSKPNQYPGSRKIIYWTFFA